MPSAAPRLVLPALLRSAVLALAACVGDSQMACKKDPVTGGDRCQPVSSHGGEAAATAALAAGSWGVVGCTVNGCTGPYHCNPKTKQCDPIECSAEGKCPGPYQCDADSDHCR